MNLEEAVASLKQDAENVAFDTAESELLPQAKRFIEAVEIVTKSATVEKWIPCADRMPEIGETDSDGGARVYWVTVERKSQNLRWRYTCEAIRETEEWEMSGKEQDKFDEKDTVLAWMPTPKEYAGK